MRALVVAATLALLQGSVHSEERALSLTMLDMDIEVQEGVAHLIEVSLDDKGDIRTKDEKLTPVIGGGYTGVMRADLKEGTLIALFYIQQHGRSFSGDYLVVGGSEAYAGARGHGSLAMLTGYEAASSSRGCYRVQLQITTPQADVTPGDVVSSVPR
jgi:hypothetical protein